MSGEQLESTVANAARARYAIVPALRQGAQRLMGSRVFLLLLAAHCLLLTASCRQDMQNQPKYIAYRSSSFFSDGMSARPLVEGTIARGFLRADREFYTGKKNRPGGVATQSAAVMQAAPQAGMATQGAGPGNATAPGGSPIVLYPDDVETFPFAITAETINRGQERYQIFCSVCHGGTGNGDGLVVRRGFRAPPTYHSDQLRQAPVGHFFDVITNGWATMPSYAAQIKPEDRWAIIAYIRALQLSQQPASGTAGFGSGEPAKGHSN